MSTPDQGRVAGAVLAAGSSTRLGRNKLLLPLGDGRGTVVGRAVRAALDAGLDPVIVVLGHEAEGVREELSGLPCLTVVNDDHARGVASSLRAGVSRAIATDDARALVVMLADMPFVTSAMISGLVARHRATRAPLVVSRYGAVEAPPHLFDRSLFMELLSVPDEGGARSVIRHHREEAVVVSWPEESLRDIDVAVDYESARSLLAAKPDLAG